MSNLRRVLERQEQEEEEIKHRRAEEDRELDEEEDEVVLAVGMLNQSRQHHHGRVLNGDIEYNPICPKKQIMHDVCNYDTYFVQKLSIRGITSTNLRLGTSKGFYKKSRLEVSQAVASFNTWVWHAFFRVVGYQNDLNVLGQSSVFNDVLRGHSP
ncbi:unnamed protein product [Prunus armeniaca]